MNDKCCSELTCDLDYKAEYKRLEAEYKRLEEEKCKMLCEIDYWKNRFDQEKEEKDFMRGALKAVEVIFGRSFFNNV